MFTGVARPPSRRASTPPIKIIFGAMLPSEWMFRFGITYVHWNVQDKSRIGMEEKRIFDLVLVKFGRFLVNCGNILVKSGFFLVFFGIDVSS